MSATKNIAFFGTPSFTVAFLDTLTRSGFTPSLVVTNPDRPSGRGMHLQAPEPKQWATAHGIQVLQPEKITDSFIEELRKEEWDLFVVVAYGAILPEALINLPKHKTINVHYSLLPKYRGATPVESAILNGDATTGVCIQSMRYKLDSGPILSAKEIAIESTDTTVTLRDRLNVVALELLPPVIDALFKGTATTYEQDESKVTVCKKIKKEDGLLSLNDDPIVNDRKYRAYQTSPGTFFMTTHKGKGIRVKIKSAHLEDGHFVLDSVIPENGKPMSGEEFERWKNT